MADDKRKDAATALTGAGLLAAGGAMRHGGVHVAYPKGKPRIHALGMLKATKGRRLFWGGTALGALGLPPVAVGTTRLVRGDVDKADEPKRIRRLPSAISGSTGALGSGAGGYRRSRLPRVDPKKVKPGFALGLTGSGLAPSFTSRLDAEAKRRAAGRFERFNETAASTSFPETAVSRRTKQLHQARRAEAIARAVSRGRIGKADDTRRGFWREGLSGTKDALHQRAESTFQPVPAKLRAAQLAAGGTAGALGSLAARAALGRRGNALKPFLTPVAGGLAATGSVPLTNRMVRRKYPDYEVTAAGVRRRKTDAKRPSSKARAYSPSPRSFRQDVGKGYDPQTMGWTPAKLDLIGMGPGRKQLRFKPNDRIGASIRSSQEWMRRSHKREIAQDRAPRRLARDKRWVQAGEVYQIRKADTYLGARTPYVKQRAAITAAGHPPLIGPFTASAAAARYAPPGQQRKQATRQLAMGSAAGVPIGVAGAYAGAHLSAHSKTAEGVATDAMKAKHAVHTAARRAVGLEEKAKKGPGRLASRFLASGAGKPFRTKAGAAGGAAGFLGAKMASGGVLGQTAITLNQRDQKRYNKLHHIEKAAGPGQTKREKHVLAQRKRRSASLQTVGGVAGLGSLGLLGAGKRQAAFTLGTIGSGLGGVNALLGARVQRQEAHAVDPFKKPVNKAMPWLPWEKGPRYAYHQSHGLLTLLEHNGKGMIKAERKDGTHVFVRREHISFRHNIGKAVGKPLLVATGSGLSNKLHAVTSAARDATYGGLDLHLRGAQEGAGYGFRSAHKAGVGRDGRLIGLHQPKGGMPKQSLRKSDSLAVTGSRKEHAQLLRQYGDRGPLPKGLDRNTRMKAYEARYVHHGGDKQNKWSRRATAAEGVKNIGTGVATAGVTGWLASRHLKSAKKIVRDYPKTTHSLESLAGLGAAIAGGGEIAAGVAHRRQASYANSPGGVAASALRRMRANTPEDS